MKKARNRREIERSVQRIEEHMKMKRKKTKVGERLHGSMKGGSKQKRKRHPPLAKAFHVYS
jgi:hypothetical protein